MLACSLGSLQGIYLLGGRSLLLLDMGGGRAITVEPFAYGIRVNLAKLSAVNLQNLDTIAASFIDDVTGPTVKTTTFFAHKGTLGANLNRLTNHCKYPLFLLVG